jgi:CHAT domain-containing protein
LFLRESATRDTFVRNAGLFGRIHIAAHAKFYVDKPLESAILFAPSGGNNGLVTVRDLYRLRMDADLVVLSACETGMSKVHKGDELIGLVRGFLYGGTRSIIATLWEIEDESASLFSTTLYDNLAKMDKPSALRSAVLTVRKKFPHPLFWAPFMFTGGV